MCSQRISQRECQYRNCMTMQLTLWKVQCFPNQPRSISLAERNSLDMWINEELRKGYIWPSTSPIVALFFFVKKHNGNLRPIMDYRALNGITIKNCYPIPRIANLIEPLSKASIFTKIDLRWGYNNVCIKEGDEWKTAFITRQGLFEATVMYFGFSNAPACYESPKKEMVSHAFKHLIQNLKLYNEIKV